jgi:hypothetical protein
MVLPISNLAVGSLGADRRRPKIIRRSPSRERKALLA